MLNNQISSNLTRVLSKSRRLFSFFLGTLILLAILFLIYNLFFFRKIYPGISVADTTVAGLTNEEALAVLTEHIQLPQKLILVSGTGEYEILLDDVGFTYDFSESIYEAYKIGRKGNIFSDFYARLATLNQKTNLLLRINIDETKLNEHLSLIVENISENPVYPQALYEKGVVLVRKGVPGIEISQAALSINIINNLASGNFNPILITEIVIDPTLTNLEADIFKIRAENIVGK